MKRSRLKNIINKSKEFSNKTVGDSYDLFVNSLPQELDYYKDGGKYRLKAAWKAYGKPSSFEEGVYNGLITSIDGGKSLIMPSIGYNTDSDEYEYLNLGRDNDIVNKDIRAWDNDVIPFIKELKRGGYIRRFNEENNCWTYSKNQLKTLEEPLVEVIDSFLKGGKTSKKKDWNAYYEFLETLPKNLQKGNDTDTLEGYRMKLLFDNTPNMWTFEDGLKGEHPVFTKQEDGYYHAPSVIQMPDGHYEFLKSYSHPSLLEEIKWYNSDDGKFFREQYRLKTKDDQGTPLTYYLYIPNNPQAFKQGGQMNVIPEGALHARRNNMELAKEGTITKKGIPVIDNLGSLQAEIERNEIIFCKRVTDKLENYYNLYKEKDSNSDKDEIAIKCGKLLVKEILTNTDDRTGLIQEMEVE